MTKQTTVTGGLSLWLTAALVSATTGRAAAEGPQLGEVRRVQVVTLSMQVGSTEKEAKQVVYAPPPGWYVRGHAVQCTEKFGHSSFSVNTVPRDWSWSSEDHVRESYKVLIDLAAHAQDHGLKAKFITERDRALAELRNVRASHHALVVDATAKGEGFLRGGGGLQLTVTAELVYVGTQDALGKALEGHRARLEGRRTQAAAR